MNVNVFKKREGNVCGIFKMRKLKKLQEWVR